MSGWREEKKALTRSRLATASVELLLTQGDEATTVAAIANMADVSTRTFHNYFARREDAFLEFIRGIFAEKAAMVREAPSEVPLLTVLKDLYRQSASRPTDALDSPLSLMMVAQHVAMVLAPEDRDEVFQIVQPMASAIAERSPGLDPFEVVLVLDMTHAAVASALRHTLDELGEDSPEIPARMDTYVDRAFERIAGGFGDLAG